MMGTNIYSRLQQTARTLHPKLGSAFFLRNGKSYTVVSQALRLDVMQDNLQSMARILYSKLPSATLRVLCLELVWILFTKRGKSSSAATVIEHWSKKIKNSPRAIKKQSTWSIDFYCATGGVR